MRIGHVTLNDERHTVGMTYVAYDYGQPLGPIAQG